MDEILLELTKNIHTKIAEDVWPKGGFLLCDRCGYELKIKSSDCAYYLAKGWPKCCGNTMKICNENQ